MKYENYDDIPFSESTTEGYDLEPCPFCCSHKVELYWDHVECERCQARGPTMANNWEMAVLVWNEMPRATGDKLKRQRSRWKSRFRTDRKITERVRAEARKERRAEVKRHKVWSEERKAWVTGGVRDREYRQWAQKRQAWLNSPVKESDDG